MSEKRLSKEWTVSAFDRVNNEWSTTTNQSYEHVPDEVDIRELLVSRAAPTKITPTRRGKSFRSDARTLVAGDAQIPFHDEQSFDRF